MKKSPIETDRAFNIDGLPKEIPEKRPAYFKIKRTAKGEFRVYIVGANGEKVYWTETYKSRQRAYASIGIVYDAVQADLIIDAPRKKKS